MATIEAWHKIVQYSIELKQLIQQQLQQSTTKKNQKKTCRHSLSQIFCVVCKLCMCWYWHLKSMV